MVQRTHAISARRRSKSCSRTLLAGFAQARMRVSAATDAAGSALANLVARADAARAAARAAVQLCRTLPCSKGVAHRVLRRELWLPRDAPREARHIGRSCRSRPARARKVRQLGRPAITRDGDREPRCVDAPAAPTAIPISSAPRTRGRVWSHSRSSSSPEISRCSRRSIRPASAAESF